ncbi:low affinity iron permease family protein [Inquilinus sp.]|uniref:low affinity iron permease family protein n=1 Tax=Inquilinus sp. TaxID=1932117 RepID=UPI0031D6B86E
MKDAPWFTRFANRVSQLAGHPATFGVAAGLMVVWAALGPLAGFSDVWQLTVNTGTTIVTFLMVFLIQNTQNRDTAALQIKIDELIRATEVARNSMLDLEEHSEEDLRELRKEYCKLAAEARGERDRERQRQRENRMES